MGAAEMVVGLAWDSRPRDPVVHHRPVEVREKRLDIGGAVRLVVEEVGVLVHVQGDERGGVPDGKGFLRVADVVEQATLVPVVRSPGPAARSEAGCLQIGPPGRGRAEVAPDQVPDRPARLAPVPAEVLEVELVVLDAAHRERQLDLELPQVGIDLVRGREVHRLEPLQDLVPLRDVPLVEPVVRVDGRARDPVELVEGRLELARCDLDEGPHGAGQHKAISLACDAIDKERPRWLSRCLISPTTTPLSSRRSTSRRCSCTTTSTIRRTSTTRTPRSRAPTWPARTSRRSCATSTACRRRSAAPSATTPAVTRTTRCSGRS